MYLRRHKRKKGDAEYETWSLAFIREDPYAVPIQLSIKG